VLFDQRRAEFIQQLDKKSGKKRTLKFDPSGEPKSFSRRSGKKSPFCFFSLSGDEKPKKTHKWKTQL
jgi:hypothetical protein